MPLILGTNSIKDTGYEVANSCRMNHGDDPIFTKTKGTPTLSTKFTWSGWVKRSRLGDDQVIANHWKDSSNYGYFYFRNGDDIRFFDRHGTGDGTDTVWISNSLFRDVSAWYHIFIKCDTTQATDTNRFKIFINGVQDTGNGITYPAEDATMAFNMSSASNRTVVGGSGDGYDYLGGYLSEIVFIDGTAYDHTDLGEFDEDSPTIWKPKDPSTLTFGDEGYYMDFEDSDNLGDDESGNASDFTETNVVAGDQTTDTPTNNFCTFNPLIVRIGRTQPTWSEGNTKVSHNDGGGLTPSWGTFLISAGKWYWESKVVTVGYCYIGIWQPEYNNGLMSDALDGIVIYRQDGNKQAETAGTTTSYGDSYTDGDIISVAVNCDTGTIWFAKNGTWQSSATEAEIEGGTTTNSAYTGKSFSLGVLPIISAYSTSVHTINFGNPAYANSSDVADENGYGKFEYSVPDGFLALCTKNLGSSGG